MQSAQPPKRLLLGILITALCTTGCANANQPQTTAKDTQIRPAHNPKLWPELKRPFDPAQTAAINKKVAAIVSKMTLEQKVGQMTQPEIGFVTPEDVKKYHLGSVLEVNVSELGLVTQTGKVVWSKYAQVTNNPELDGCINSILLV